MATATNATSIHGTLTASTVDTATITGTGAVMRVTNRGTSDIWYLLSEGGTPSNPTAAANGTYFLPPGACDEFPDSEYRQGDWVVKLISASTPAYSVELLP